ncbi:MAG TPA: N-acetylmuramoyl-L-alanine amidase [Streptosporangiaceae bacterium]|nr:N-acetylmuramoyl-L-alanine amidase [Streptosporangiaceae bacterium]
MQTGKVGKQLSSGGRVVRFKRRGRATGGIGGIGGIVLTMAAVALAACGGPASNEAAPPGGAAARPTAPSSGAAAGDTTGGGASEQPAAPRDDALAGKVIVLDPGHNGGDADHPEIANKLVDVITKRKPCDSTGTETPSGYPEHAFTWDVANRLAKLLRAKGAKVFLTRTSDTGVGPCVTERAAIGNRHKADAALSIHADGAGKKDHGFHIIEPAPLKGHNEHIVPDSKELGRAIRDAYREGTGIPYSTYRGTDAIDVRDDLGGLNLSKRPKVFIECGNMKHAGDRAKLESASFRERIARSLADGFAAYFSS